ncbi:hypothetical protein [Streptomyces griseus]|uniref:hypothetical protein n=1 Tax=Streptomyces griseus TaxID=1911 RepID=UPI00131B473F|nr:hypothetical protein [Streptomyces griseus]
MSEPNRQLLLSDLDRLAVGARAEWGQLLLDMLAAARWKGNPLRVGSRPVSGLAGSASRPVKSSNLDPLGTQG